jgi:hypothetical protein
VCNNRLFRRSVGGWEFLADYFWYNSNGAFFEFLNGRMKKSKKID